MSWLLQCFSLILGYAFGNISGQHLGHDRRIPVLVDILKCVVALAFLRWATTISIQDSGVLFGALGLVLGHLYPYWTKKRPANAIVVIVTCWVMIRFTWGISGLLIGAFVLLVTHYVPLALLVVPVFGLIASIATGGGGWMIFVALILCIFAFVGYQNELHQIRMGKYKKFDIRDLTKK